jgi:molybdopterin synthase catalytic subunit
MAAVSADRVLVCITPETLAIDEALAHVADPGAGGTCVFVGTVRDASDHGEAVTGLTYEAWEELAMERLRELATRIEEKWPVRKVALMHRVGHLPVGEASVVVAVSSAHRAEAFEACRFGIEELKHDVPIWKREALASGGANWVMGA